MKKKYFTLWLNLAASGWLHIYTLLLHTCGYYIYESTRTVSNALTILNTFIIHIYWYIALTLLYFEFVMMQCIINQLSVYSSLCLSVFFCVFCCCWLAVVWCVYFFTIDRLWPLLLPNEANCSWVFFALNRPWFSFCCFFSLSLSSWWLLIAWIHEISVCQELCAHDWSD